jgi:hypothetical protein
MTNPTACCASGATSGIARNPADVGRSCRTRPSKVCGTTLDHSPDRTWATSDKTEFVSTAALGALHPPATNRRSIMHRFCMSRVSRQSGNSAASRHVTSGMRPYGARAGARRRTARPDRSSCACSRRPCQPLSCPPSDGRGSGRAVLSVFRQTFPRIQIEVRRALSGPTIDRLPPAKNLGV